MPTYITLMSFTEQGVRNVKETTKRAESLKALAQKMGVNVKEIYWTLGQYDLVAVVEGPNEETMTALGLSLGSLGNVRTETLRGFSAEEMNRIIAKMA
jgi:uncharacterized protein with GYD domain